MNKNFDFFFKLESYTKFVFLYTHLFNPELLVYLINIVWIAEPNSSLQNQDDVRYFTNYSASINSSETASQNGPINFNLNITDTEDDLKVSGLNETSNGKHRNFYESDII